MDKRIIFAIMAGILVLIAVFILKPVVEEEFAAHAVYDVTPSPEPTATPAPTAVPVINPAPEKTPFNDVPPTPSVKPSIKPKPTLDTESKLIALTFDDGPSRNATPRILDVIEQYAGQNVHVTFFVVGEKVLDHPDYLRRAVELGCEIGNHSYSHANLTKISIEEIDHEIGDTAKLIEEITGIAPTLVRPPYGAKNDYVYENVPYPLIIWNVDTLDWSTRDAQSTFEAALNARDGDIVLMHDLREDTGEAAERIIPELLARGYKLVTITELFEAKGIDLVAGRQYRNARPRD